jgi:hypothetical protein
MEDIDRRIAVLEGQIIELKAQRNALTPVCRLPAETLAHILSYVQHGGHDHDPLRPWRTYSCTWARTMCVCRRFRTVALDTPRLWAYVDVSLDGTPHSQAWAALVEQRSKTALAVSGSGAAAFLPTARSVRMAITALLDRSINMASFTGTCRDLLGRPAPFLERLEFDCKWLHLYVGAAFLGGAATALRELSLTRAVLGSGAPQIPALQRLELVCAITARRAGFAPLVDFLSHTPQLQTLCLAGLWMEPSPDLPLQRPQNLLPDLQALFIEGCPSSVANYMRILPLPLVSLGIVLLDNDPRFDHSDWDSENYAYAYSLWEEYMATRVCPSGRVTLLADRPHGIRFDLGAPVLFSEFNAASGSFLSIQSSKLCAHPVLAGIETVRIVQVEGYGQSPCFEDAGAFGIDRMPDLRVVVLDRLRAVGIDGEDDLDASRLAEDLLLWILALAGRVEDVRLVQCSESMRDVAEDLEQLGFNVIWED